MDSLDPSKSNPIPPGSNEHSHSSSPAQRSFEVERQTPQSPPQTPDTALSQRTTSVHEATPTLTSSHDLLSYSAEIPDHTTPEQQQRQQQLDNGLQVVGTVRFDKAKHLQKLKPIDVIRTTTDGDLSGKVEAGYGSKTNKGIAVHSSKVNLDEPIAVTCRKKAASVAELIAALEKRSNGLPMPIRTAPALPATELEKTPISPALERLQQSSAQQHTVTEQPLQQSQRMQAKTSVLRDTVQQTNEQATTLQRQLSEVSTQTARFKQQTHQALTSSSVHTSHLRQSLRTEPESDEQAIQLQQHVQQQEQSIQTLLVENDKLRGIHGQLLDALENHSATITSMEQELEKALADKQSLDVELQQLKDADIKHRPQIKQLQEEKQLLLAQISSLEGQLEQSHAALAEIEQQLTQSRANNQQLQQNINLQLRNNDQLKKECSNLKHLLANSNNQVNIARESMQQAQAKLNTAEARLRTVLEESQQFHQKLQQSQHYAESLQDQLSQSQKVQHELQQQTDQLVGEKKLWAKEQLELEQELAKQYQVLEVTKQEFTAGERCLEDALALSEDLVNDLKISEDQVRTTKQQLTAQEQRLERTLADHTRQQELMTETLNKSRTENNQLKQQVSSHQQKYTALLSAIKTQLPDTELANAEHGDTLNQLELAIGQLIASHSSLSSQLVAEQKLRSEEQHALALAQQELGQEQSALAKERKELIASQQQVAELHQQLQHHKDQQGVIVGKEQEAATHLESSQQAIVTLEHEKQELLAQLVANQAMQQAQEELDNEQIEALARELTEAKQQVGTLTQQLEQERGNNHKLQDALTRFEQEVKQCTQTTVEAHRKINTLEHTLAARQEQLDEVTKEYQSQQTTLHDTKKELTTVGQQLSQSKETQQQQSLEIEQLKQQLQAKAELDAMNASFMEQLADAEKQRLTLEEQLATTQTSEKQLIDQRSQLTEEIATLQEMLAPLQAGEQDHKRLQNSIAALEKTVQEQDQQLTAQQSAIADKQTQLQTLEQTIAEQATALAAKTSALDELQSKHQKALALEKITNSTTQSQQQELEQIRQELQDATANASQLAEKLIEAAQVQTTLNQQLEQEQNAHKQELQTLKAHNQRSQEKQTSLANTVTQLKTQQRDMKSSHEKLKAINSDLQQRLTSTQEIAATSIAALKKQTEEAGAIERENRRIRDSWDALQSNLAAYLQQLPNNNFNPPTRLRAGTLDELTELDPAGVDVEQSLALNEQPLQLALGSLAQAWGKVQAYNNTLFEHSGELKEQLEKVQERLGETESENSLLRQQVAYDQESHEALMQERSRLQQELSQNQAKLARQEDDLGYWEKQNTTLRDQLEAALDNVRKLEKQGKNLTRAPSTTDQDYQSLATVKQLERAEKRVKSLQKQLSQQRGAFNSLDTRTANRERAFYELKDEIKRRDHLIQQMAELFAQAELNANSLKTIFQASGDNDVVRACIELVDGLSPSGTPSRQDYQKLLEQIESWKITPEKSDQRLAENNAAKLFSLLVDTAEQVSSDDEESSPSLSSLPSTESNESGFVEDDRGEDADTLTSQSTTFIGVGAGDSIKAQIRLDAPHTVTVS